jgi:hypothetical protein
LPCTDAFEGFALAFGDGVAADFAGCLTIEDFGVCLLRLEVFRPLAGMTVD